MLDLLDYNDFIIYDRFIPFLDFYKAFDSLVHDFILKVLVKSDLGIDFCKTIRTCEGNHLIFTL